jgi:hypothetical protein
VVNGANSAHDETLVMGSFPFDLATNPQARYSLCSESERQQRLRGKGRLRACLESQPEGLIFQS